MKSRKGFTLIELMVVVLIVAVLAALLIPMFTARLEAARWSEGKAAMGALATAVRAMAAESGETGDGLSTNPLDYLTAGDLQGKYFSAGNYSFAVDPVYTPTGTYPVVYTIRCETGDVEHFPTIAAWQLDYMGNWTKEER